MDTKPTGRLKLLDIAEVEPLAGRYADVCELAFGAIPMDSVGAHGETLGHLAHGQKRSQLHPPSG